MKMFLAILGEIGALLLTHGALAQNGNMMNEGMSNAGWMGGYGGMWVWILLCVVVIAAVVWIFVRKGK